MQDSPNIHAHPHALAHVNGATNVPSTPGGLSNGSSHHMVSPAAAPTTVANGTGAAPPATASSSIIHKLAVANEQTWLLIGACFPRDLLASGVLTVQCCSIQAG